MRSEATNVDTTYPCECRGTEFSDELLPRGKTDDVIDQPNSKDYDEGRKKTEDER
jgi:hypothetical protein